MSLNNTESVSILCIGDPHIEEKNIKEVEFFIEKLLILVDEKKPDLIVILGDVLSDFERVHTIALNKAYELVDKLRNIQKTYVLVGNHDMYNNQQFLTENHWMNGMKEWENVVIVDKIVSETINNKLFIFAPYVYPGRFIEALDTYNVNSNLDWKNASCIFAHQEIAGCKMGAIISVEGDKWPVDYPPIVSGHIHMRQTPQKNVYYPGSAMQHAFGESEKNIISILSFNDKINKGTNLTYCLEEIDLQLPRKKIIYLDVEDIETFELNNQNSDHIKITLSGNYEQFKALKKNKKYKDLIDKGLKIVFKPKKLEVKKDKAEKEEEIKKVKSKGEKVKTLNSDGEEVDNNENDQEVENEPESKPEPVTTQTDFQGVLYNLINNKKDSYLYQAYELVVNNREIQPDDVLFL